jgi:hypothetical protein
VPIDDIIQAARRADPLLAKHITRAITINHERHIETLLQLCSQRHLVVTPEVRQPSLAGTWEIDAGHNQTGGADRFPIRRGCYCVADCVSDLPDRRLDVFTIDRPLRAMRQIA